jgi:hypothetical protein
MNEDLCWIVERAVDDAFSKDKYLLNFYKFLEHQNAKRKDAAGFLESNSKNLECIIDELKLYVAGGNKQLLEAYRHVGKTKARKIITYLEKIIQDAKDYEHDKRPGRRKGSKSKRRTVHK